MYVCTVAILTIACLSSGVRSRLIWIGLINTFAMPIQDLRRRGELLSVKGIISSFLVLWVHLRNSVPPPSRSLGNSVRIILWNSVGQQSISGIVISFSPKPARIKELLFKGRVSSLVSAKQKNLCDELVFFLLAFEEASDKVWWCFLKLCLCSAAIELFLASRTAAMALLKALPTRCCLSVNIPIYIH